MHKQKSLNVYVLYVLVGVFWHTICTIDVLTGVSVCTFEYLQVSLGVLLVF